MDADKKIGMLQEGEIIPFHASTPIGDRIIVLAPHPDDETLGCGGSLRLLSKAGKVIKVIFLTKGEEANPTVPDKQRYTALREREASKAMGILGISNYEFLRFPDRKLHANIEKATDMISIIVRDFRPDTLYSPSMIELNPDHRAAAALAKDMMKIFGITVVFYELTTPIRPNILVDITSVFRIKKKRLRLTNPSLRFSTI